VIDRAPDFVERRLPALRGWPTVLSRRAYGTRVIVAIINPNDVHPSNPKHPHEIDATRGGDHR
jgi:hypothetical protein